MVAKIAGRKIRGIRDSIPAGYVLGRVSTGEGDVQLIHLDELGKQLTGGSGGVGGGGVASSTSVQTAQSTAAGANSQASVALALAARALAYSGVVAAIDYAPETPAMPQGPNAFSALADVSISAPTTGDVPIYNATTGRWENTGFAIFIQKDCGDETTAITAATGKKTFRMPHAMTLAEVRASLTTAQATGSIFTVDVQQGGVSIFSTLLTIDNTESTSKTAATPAVLSATTLYDDDEMRIDVTQIGDGTATGLKVTLIGTQSNAVPVVPVVGEDDDYAAWMAAA